MEIIVLASVTLFVFYIFVKFGLAMIASTLKILERLAQVAIIPLVGGLIYDPEGTFILIAKFLNQFRKLLHYISTI